jgi:hypothetical protein
MGSNTLLIYDPAGHRRAAIGLPEVCVGMDYIPGGGLLLGGGMSGTVYHFTADGLLLGSVKPGTVVGGTSGLLDNFASVAVNRDPRDRILDVFTEENLVGRILWYRIDDSSVGQVTGNIP